MATEKQKSFIRKLLRQTGDMKPTGWVENLSVREASKLIEELLENGPRPAEHFRLFEQGNLPLPPPEAPTDELGEFKRWARGVYQRGEMGVIELIALQREKFGIPDMEAR